MLEWESKSAQESMFIITMKMHFEYPPMVRAVPRDQISLFMYLTDEENMFQTDMEEYNKRHFEGGGKLCLYGVV